MKNKSFTLIEVLMVIVIIGIIAGIVVVSTGGARKKAEKARVAEQATQFMETLLIQGKSNVVGWWNFDEGTGKEGDSADGETANDYSAHGNSGTIYGAEWAEGALHSALEFDGENDYVNCGSGSSLDITDAITIEAWVKFVDFLGGENDLDVVARKDSSYVLYFTETDGVGLDFYFWSTSYRLKYLHNFENDRWYHVAGSYDGAVGKLYVDGVEVASHDVVTTLPSNPTTHVAIGATSDGSGMYFNGLIDEVRIYNKALHFSQIQKHYAQGAARHGIVLK